MIQWASISLRAFAIKEELGTQLLILRSFSEPTETGFGWFLERCIDTLTLSIHRDHGHCWGRYWILSLYRSITRSRERNNRPKRRCRRTVLSGLRRWRRQPRDNYFGGREGSFSRPYKVGFIAKYILTDDAPEPES